LKGRGRGVLGKAAVVIRESPGPERRPKQVPANIWEKRQTPTLDLDMLGRARAKTG